MWPLAPPQGLPSPTPYRHPPSHTCGRHPCPLTLGSPLSSKVGAHGRRCPRGWVGPGLSELSLCMWHWPLPRLAPLVSSGQGAGRGEEGWGGASTQNHRDTGHKGHQGAEKGWLWLEREGEPCNRSPSFLQALGSGMERPRDQSCPVGGGRAGQPLGLPYPTPGPGSFPKQA